MHYTLITLRCVAVEKVLASLLPSDLEIQVNVSHLAVHA